MADLISLNAREINRRLRNQDIAPFDCLDALEARIGEVDKAVNALPTLCFERARDHAKALMQKPAGERGLLAGLPIPIKDLNDVAGVRSTQGSPIFANNIPKVSDILVENLETQGGIVSAVTGFRRSCGLVPQSRRLLAVTRR